MKWKHFQAGGVGPPLGLQRPGGGHKGLLKLLDFTHEQGRFILLNWPFMSTIFLDNFSCNTIMTIPFQIYQYSNIEMKGMHVCYKYEIPISFGSKAMAYGKGQSFSKEGQKLWWRSQGQELCTRRKVFLQKNTLEKYENPISFGFKSLSWQMDRVLRTYPVIFFGGGGGRGRGYYKHGHKNRNISLYTWICNWLVHKFTIYRLLRKLRRKVKPLVHTHEVESCYSCHWSDSLFSFFFSKWSESTCILEYAWLCACTKPTCSLRCVLKYKCSSSNKSSNWNMFSLDFNKYTALCFTNNFNFS